MEKKREEKQAVQSLMTDMVAVIPPLNMVMGVKDVTSCAWDLYKGNYRNKQEENGLRIQLALGILCFVPGAGVPVRTAFRQLLRSPDVYAPLMFEVVTMIIEKTNVVLKSKGYPTIPVNPEQVLLQMIDTKVLKAYVEKGRQAALSSAKDSVFNRWFDIGGTINKCFDFIGQNLTVCISMITPIVLDSIRKSKSRIANTGVHGNIRNGSTPQQNPGRPSETRSQTKKDNPTRTHTGGNLKEQVRKVTANLNGFYGGIGEHIADYYCLENLGWGKGSWIRHDEHVNGKWKEGSTYRKLNERGKLKKLQPIGNDKGIDGFWKANPSGNGGKPYAVVEAKASASHLGRDSDLAKMLTVLTEKMNGRHVVQMDHEWIRQRLSIMLPKMPADVQADFERITSLKKWKLLYRRHIIFTALHLPETDGFKHAEALLNGSGESSHRSHKPTRHINNEREIDGIIRMARNRAKTDEQRHKAKGKKIK